MKLSVGAYWLVTSVTLAALVMVTKVAIEIGEVPTTVAFTLVNAIIIASWARVTRHGL